MLRPRATRWTLSFQYDGADLIAWTFDDREAAAAEAGRRLLDLQRAGWNVHW